MVEGLEGVLDPAAVGHLGGGIAVLGGEQAVRNPDGFRVLGAQRNVAGKGRAGHGEQYQRHGDRNTRRWAEQWRRQESEQGDDKGSAQSAAESLERTGDNGVAVDGQKL